MVVENLHAVARLRGLLDVTRLVRSEEDLPTLLDAIVRTISETLGFDTVAVNVYRAAWDDFSVTAVHGSEEARAALLGQTTDLATWAPLLDERFLRHGAYLIPHGSFDWSSGDLAHFIPAWTGAEGADAWHPEDALLVPLAHSDGHLLGIMSVDEPRSGRRPSDEEIEVLAAVSAHAALALQEAQERAEAARHRAALEHLLVVSAQLRDSDNVETSLGSVARGIREALGFEKVSIHLRQGDCFAAAASAGWLDGDRALILPLTPEQAEALFDPECKVEGCYLLTAEQARARVGLAAQTYSSELNGHGPRAWDHHWLHVPLRDADGALAGFIWVDDPEDRMLPSTERLQALRTFANQASSALAGARHFEALREADERRRALIDASPVAIMDLDLDGTVRAWNPAAERMFGWAREEIIGRKNPMVPPESQTQFDATRARVAAGETITGLELKRVRADGSDIQVRLSASPLHDATGAVTGIAALLEDVTDQVDTHARKAAILEAALDAIVTMDGTGVVIEWNPAAEETFGWTADEAMGKPLIDLIIPTHLHESYMAEGPSFVNHGRVEILAKRSNGREFPAELTLTQIDAASGPLFTCYLRDITKRKDSEDRLRETERKYRTLVEGLPLATYVNELGDPIRTIYMSPQIEPMLGYEPERWYEEAFFASILHPDDRQRVLDGVTRTHESGEAFSDEYRLIAADGREVWVFDETIAVRDDEYRPLYLQGCLLDVTERKRAEEGYRTIFENANDLICTTDLDGNLTAVNDAFVRVSGYTRDELLSMNSLELMAPEAVEETHAHLQRLARGEIETATFQVAAVTKNGRRVALECAVQSLVENGQIVGRQSIIRDVSERATLEAQLHQSQKMDAVGQLAGGIAHDFNNLLTVISGYTEFALRRLGADESPLRHELAEIERAAQRASALTQQLLAFSRKQVLEPQVVGLNGIVENVSTMLQRLIGEDVEFLARCGDGIGSVKVDPTQVEQVLLNLVVNARDAMPGGGCLTIETAETDVDEAAARPHAGLAPGPYVCLSVTDTGRGMDEETRRRVFEPFFTTKPSGEGTGLGLSTVYGIVKQSGGYVAVYSEEGVGTSFRIYFPRADEPAEVAVAAPVPPRQEPGSETILLTEDDDFVRAVVVEILESQSYRVLPARDGEEALTFCREHPGEIDLLLTDVVMPRLGGRELAERATELRPGLRVLYTSGYPDAAIVQHGVLQEGLSFLQKPFSHSELARKVREVLEAPARVAEPLAATD